MKIRKYRDSDRRQLIALWVDAFPDDPPHNEPSAVIDAKLAVDNLIFVAESAGKIIGACIAGYDGHRGWLYAVAVQSEYRRQGIGAKIVQHAMIGLEELGCVKVNLQIRPGNSKAVEFYQSLGFTVEERISMGALL